MDLPQEYEHVMITYIGNVRIRDKYYDHYEKQQVTRRAFFTKSDGFYSNKDEWIETPNGFFHVPVDWREFTWSDGTTTLEPFGFNHHGRVYPKDIIKWELVQNEEKSNI